MKTLAKVTIAIAIAAIAVTILNNIVLAEMQANSQVYTCDKWYGCQEYDPDGNKLPWYRRMAKGKSIRATATRNGWLAARYQGRTVALYRQADFR